MLREREKDKERKRERAFVPGFRRVYFYFSNFEESLRNINTSVTEFNRVSPATSIRYERNYLVDWYFPELNGLISMKRVQSMGLLDFSYIILLLCVVSMIQSTWHGCYWYNQSIDGGTEFHRILRSRCLLRGPMSSFYHLSSFSVSLPFYASQLINVSNMTSNRYHQSVGNWQCFTGIFPSQRVP